MGTKVNIEEWENLSWYELLSKMGVKSINWVGEKSWDTVMEESRLPEDAKILLIGCGAGKNCLFLAKKFGVHVTGIDIAEASIQMAKESAQLQQLENFTEFQVADAYALPFPIDSFDGVFTEYMSYFLDLPVALKEFYRVLKPNGIMGFNEIMLDPETPEKTKELIKTTGVLFEEITGYPLKILSTQKYVTMCEAQGLHDISLTIFKERITIKQGFQLIGGPRNFWKLMRLMTVLSRKSPAIRHKFKIQAKVKKIVFRQRKTAKYVQTAICLARK
jgi:ubiquinone/menaquinone biosynthesis C-methylase UbiE